MSRERQHLERSRGEGISEGVLTANARMHHALSKDGVVLTEMLPGGPRENESIAILEEMRKSGKRRKTSLLHGAERVFVAHKQIYTIRKRGGVKATHVHGFTDGLENRVLRSSLPPLGGVWIDQGGVGVYQAKIRHEWQKGPDGLNH